MMPTEQSNLLVYMTYDKAIKDYSGILIMSKCTSRKEDWTRFGKAFLSYKAEARHTCPILGYVLGIGHTGKNIIVEEKRRIFNEC